MPATSYNTYAAVIKRTAKAAGLPASFSTHDFRHLYGSTLLAGVPLTDVSTWLGHRATSQIYSHLLPSSWDRGRTALESLAA
jgi:integrase